MYLITSVIALCLVMETAAMYPYKEIINILSNDLVKNDSQAKTTYNMQWSAF